MTALATRRKHLLAATLVLGGGLAAALALNWPPAAPVAVSTPPPAALPVPVPTPGLPGPAPPASAPGAPDVEATKRAIRAAVTAQPRDFDVRVRAAEFLMRAGEYREAIPHLEAAIGIAPDRLLPWLALGDAATLTGQYALAERSYRRGALLAPEHPLLLRGHGQLLVAQKRYGEARRLLEKALKQHPEDPEIGHALGNLLLLTGDPIEAIAVLKAASEKAPERADLHYLLGDAYARDRHLGLALEQHREAVRLEPRMAEAWGRMGLYLVNLSRYQEARPPLLQAIQLEPENSYYYWSLGDSYALDPSDPGNVERGLGYYRQALKLEPGNEKALYACALALTRRGAPADLQEAVGLFNRLLKANPDQMSAHYKLYEIYRHQGRAREAEAHMAKFRVVFEKGRRQNYDFYQAASFRDTAEAHLKLGRQALARGNYELAAKEFRFALERNRTLPGAQEGLEEAQRLRGTGRGGTVR